MLRLLTLALLAGGAPAQFGLSPYVVLAETAGARRSTMFFFDAALGTIDALPRFTSDALAPLAVVADPIDGDLLVAVADSGGLSRIVRLRRNGLTLAEAAVGSVVGKVTGLAVVRDELFVAVDAPNGGVHRLPRRGGAPSLALAMANVTAIRSVSTTLPLLLVAWTGRPGTSVPDSGAGVYDCDNAAWLWGPSSFANPAGRTVVAVLVLQTMVPGCLLAFDDGGFAAFAPQLGPPQPLPNTAPTAVVAMRDTSSYVTPLAALGRGAAARMYAVDRLIGTATPISPPFPGLPVDFVPSASQTARSFSFADACGGLLVGHTVAGLPKLGSTLSLAASWVQTAPVVLAVGFDDVLGGLLPAPLPGGCSLHVAPEVTVLKFRTMPGGTGVDLAIPNLPPLIGTSIFSQWLAYDPAGLSTSVAYAHRIGP